MMKEVIATGRTVDAAIDSGCAELGLERGDVDFEIISMPKKGFLGLILFSSIIFSQDEER